MRFLGGVVGGEIAKFVKFREIFHILRIRSKSFRGTLLSASLSVFSGVSSFKIELSRLLVLFVLFALFAVAVETVLFEDDGRGSF